MYGGGQSGHGHYIVFLYTGYPGTGHLDPPTSLGLATPLGDFVHHNRVGCTESMIFPAFLHDRFYQPGCPEAVHLSPD